MKFTFLLLMMTLAIICEGSSSKIDKEPPQLFWCPEDIVKVASSDRPEWIHWPIPIYTDNCGDSSVCPLQIFNQYGGNSLKVLVGGRYNIEYIAIDPSNNVNRECSFSIHLKAHGCDYLEPPENGAIIRTKENLYFRALCVKPYFPAKQFAIVYVCRQRKWFSMMDPVKVNPVSKLDPCKYKMPPGRPVTSIDLMLQFDGNCNKASVKEMIRKDFKTMIGSADTEVSCGMAGCVTTEGKKCVFPFRYKNKSYYSCTTANHDRPWCSVQNKVDGHYKQWGNCNVKTCDLKKKKCLMKYDRPGGCPNYGKVRIANGILDFGDRSECDKACLENPECAGYMATTGRCWLVKKGCVKQTGGNIKAFKYYTKSCN